MYRFPSINQFRNVVQHVREHAAFLGLDEQGKAIYNLTRSLAVQLPWLQGVGS